LKSSILGGKFISVFITLVFQTAVILVASHYLFNIHWGQPSVVIFTAFGLVIAASGFGVLLMSLIENTRQVGPILGGVLTVTGMLGGLFTNGIPNIPEVFETINLTMPQGWALRAWKMTLAGSSMGDLMLPVGVLLLVGLAFLSLGVLVFRKRFS
jgi:ABC-2 type transport system permease protein